MSTNGTSRTKRNGHARDDSLATVIRDSANQIWLAGLGAYARAEEEGTRLFDTLVALGERVETRARDQVFRPIRAAERKAGEVRDTASGAAGHLRVAFERRVAKILNALQIPTSRDVDELTQRVEELTVALARMERRAATQRSRAAAATRSSSKSAGARTRKRSTTSAGGGARRASTRKTASGSARS
jgi:poly(hydroxyalkanoate) granule-associated protein